MEDEHPAYVSKACFQRIGCKKMMNKFPGKLFSRYKYRYGDSVDSTVEENSSVFSLIGMCWLPSSRACRQ